MGVIFGVFSESDFEVVLGSVFGSIFGFVFDPSWGSFWASFPEFFEQGPGKLFERFLRGWEGRSNVTFFNVRAPPTTDLGS